MEKTELQIVSLTELDGEQFGFIADLDGENFRAALMYAAFMVGDLGRSPVTELPAGPAQRQTVRV